jgi:hypothetical protein
MRLALSALVLLLCGCTATRAPADPRDALVAGLAGAWDNRQQFAAAPDSLKVPPSVDGEWLDLQHAMFTRVDAPALGDHVLYLEWRSGGPEGTISRQRLWSFRNDPADGLRMDFYAFIDGKPYAGKGTESGTFRSLTTAALRGYGPACALRFDLRGAGFMGAISAEECTITAASGRRMGINARVALTADGSLEYQESGVLDDGRYAFRVPPTEPYRFRRLR